MRGRWEDELRSVPDYGQDPDLHGQQRHDRCDPRVVEAMLPYFTEHYGNAASRNHPFGWEAEEAVETAREQVASLIGAGAKEIIFTSGATESNNLAIKGVAAMYKKKGNHVITPVTEHKAVIDPCKRLERDGFQVTFLPVDKYGRVSAEQVAAALTDQTILVSLMAANNEIGTLQPIKDIGKLCKPRAFCSTPTPCRRSARCRWTSRTWASTCCQPVGAQDLRTKGHRRPVRSPQEPARASRSDHRRRRPRTRHAQRHVGRCRTSSVWAWPANCAARS